MQNLVAAQKDRVWSLIEQGAIIYVCGDGGKMEPDVKAALVAIYRERTGGDADAAQRWIDDLGTKTATCSTSGRAANVVGRACSLVHSGCGRAREVETLSFRQPFKGRMPSGI